MRNAFAVLRKAAQIITVFPGGCLCTGKDVSLRRPCIDMYFTFYICRSFSWLGVFARLCRQNRSYQLVSPNGLC